MNELNSNQEQAVIHCVVLTCYLILLSLYFLFEKQLFQPLSKYMS